MPRGRHCTRELQQVMLYIAGQRKIPWRLAPRFIRRAPELWLLYAFDLARPPVPDVLVLETVSPPRAMERLRSRGEALESHENDEFLGRLVEAYGQVAGVLRRRGGTEVVAFVPGREAADEVADRVDEAGRRLALAALAASSR